MLIVGERINSTKEKVKAAIRERDASFIAKTASSQVESGCGYVDVNCAVTSGNELHDMDWVLSVIQSEIKNVNICVDSPNYLAIEAALKAYHSKGSLMINSISGDEARIRSIMPLAIKYNSKLIALTMDEKGMPNTAADRFEAAKKIFELAKDLGIKMGSADLVINKVTGFLEPLQGEIRSTGVEFIGTIPFDEEVDNWSISNKPIFEFESVTIKDRIREIFTKMTEK